MIPYIFMFWVAHTLNAPAWVWIMLVIGVFIKAFSTGIEIMKS